MVEADGGSDGSSPEDAVAVADGLVEPLAERREFVDEGRTGVVITSSQVLPLALHHSTQARITRNGPGS